MIAWDDLTLEKKKMLFELLYFFQIKENITIKLQMKDLKKKSSNINTELTKYWNDLNDINFKILVTSFIFSWQKPQPIILQTIQ